MSRLCSAGGRAAKASSRGGHNRLCFRKLIWPGDGDLSESYCNWPGRGNGVSELCQRRLEWKDERKVWKLSADEVTGEIYIFLMFCYSFQIGTYSFYFYFLLKYSCFGLSQGFSGKESTCNAGDVSGAVGSIPGSGRSPGKEIQHSCLENPMDRGACWATVHELAKESDTT